MIKTCILAVESQLCGAYIFSDFPLICWGVKNQSCQVIRVRLAHRLKVLQLSSEVIATLSHRKFWVSSKI